MDEETRAALELLGEIRLQGVRQPQVEGQEDPEEETYRWFVANDQGSGRRPNKLDAAEESLEPLDHWLARRNRGGPFPQLPENPWRGD